MSRNRDMAESERTYLWTGPFFGKVVADRVRFALTRHFFRKAQVADVIYNNALFKIGIPVPRDFTLAFCAENPLKPVENRKIKLKINDERYHAQFQRPGPAREYLILYHAEGEVAQALTIYLADELEPRIPAFINRFAGRNELDLKAPANQTS